MNLKILYLFSFLFFAFTQHVTCQKNTDETIVDYVNEYIKRVNKNLELTKLEKGKLFKLKETYYKKYLFVEHKYKNHSKLDDQRIKVNLAYSKSVVQEFGKKRGIEILEASKILAGTYSVKTNVN